MRSMKRPSVTTARVADHYAMRGERIVEFLFPDGTGGLLSFRNLGGKHGNVIDIYNVTREQGGLTVYGASSQTSKPQQPYPAAKVVKS